MFQLFSTIDRKVHLVDIEVQSSGIDSGSEMRNLISILLGQVSRWLGKREMRTLFLLSSNFRPVYRKDRFVRHVLDKICRRQQNDWAKVWIQVKNRCFSHLFGINFIMWINVGWLFPIFLFVLVFRQRKADNNVTIVVPDCIVCESIGYFERARVAKHFIES